jgi:DNA-binding response OmpR family regulator
VLVVDDDRLAREKVKSMLAGMGFRCMATEEWPEISKIVAAEDVEVILMDIEMPHLSGDRIASVLLKRLENPPRILLHSSRSEGELATQAELIGAHGYVQKGMDAQEYEQRIRAAIAQRAAEMAG